MKNVHFHFIFPFKHVIVTNYSRICDHNSCIYITLKCILIHFGFHYILSEFGHFYHGKINQPLNEWVLVVMDNELVH